MSCDGQDQIQGKYMYVLFPNFFITWSKSAVP